MLVMIIFIINSKKLILQDDAGIKNSKDQTVENDGSIESFKFVSVIIITMLVLAANASFIAYISPFYKAIGYSNKYLTISMLILGIGSLVGSKKVQYRDIYLLIL